MSYVCYQLNHISCESLKGQIPLTKPYGVTPDISIIMMYTFYQSVYYASDNQSSPSTSEENMHFGLVLVNMWVILSPTNCWTFHPIRSYIDLLFDQLMISIPKAFTNRFRESVDPTNPNPSHLLNPVRILTNLSVNPWLNTIQMTLKVTCNQTS